MHTINAMQNIHNLSKLPIVYPVQKCSWPYMGVLDLIYDSQVNLPWEKASSIYYMTMEIITEDGYLLMIAYCTFILLNPWRQLLLSVSYTTAFCEDQVMWSSALPDQACF